MSKSTRKAKTSKAIVFKELPLPPTARAAVFLAAKIREITFEIEAAQDLMGDKYEEWDFDDAVEQLVGAEDILSMYFLDQYVGRHRSGELGRMLASTAK